MATSNGDISDDTISDTDTEFMSESSDDDEIVVGGIPSHRARIGQRRRAQGLVEVG